MAACKLDAIVGQDRVDPVRHRFQQVLKELPRRSPVSRVDKLGDREFTRVDDADEQVELPSAVCTSPISM